MSDDFLFAVPETKSPRLLWIEKHHVETKQDSDFRPDTEDDKGNEKFAWYASDDKWLHRYGANTELDALFAWAKSRHVRMWYEESMP